MTTIKLQKTPKCIWHVNCLNAAPKSGIMQAWQHQTTYSTAICLGCGIEAIIPVGTPFGIPFTADTIHTCIDCYPEHCTDLNHGGCWCEPEITDGLRIHSSEC